jgi:ATP-binding cassette, subfamily B, multidrug efflux pump
MRRLFGLTHGMRALMVVALLLLLASKGIEVLVPIWLGRLMQSVLDTRQLPWTPIFALVGWLFVAYIFDGGNAVLMRLVGERVIVRLRTDLFAHMQQLDVAFFDRQRVGQLMSRTIADTERINFGISQSLISIIGSMLMLIGIFIGMFFVDWRVALLIALSMPLLFWLTHTFRVNQRSSYAAVRSSLGHLNTFMQEHLFGLRVIRNFGLEEQESAKFETLNQDFRERNVETIEHFARFFAGLEWTKNLILTLTFVGLVLFATQGQPFDAGTFFTFSLYLLLFFRPLRFLAEQYNIFQDALASADRVFALFQEQPTLTSGNAPLDTVDQITFENVSFSYGEEPVLQNISFTVERGQTVAIVGPTGAGKSTLISLLCRFYDPTAGLIRVNGADIRDFDLHAFRHQFNVVLQDPAIFSGTVAENVSLYSDLDVESALRFVGAWDFVQKLPQGIDTPVKDRLSAGQRQLIALARAVAHPGSVLILDEATANIDAVSEQLISKVLQDRTALVIAHRLSTIRNADLILVMHEGKILERGTHSQLLAKGGLYARLHNTLA